MNHLPLKDIRVVDLTRLLPGPFCTMYLADLGADVIKVEDTVMGDYLRFVPPFSKQNSLLFNTINRNKRSIQINLKEEKGKEVFFKIIQGADVLIEGFRPGVTKKLGISYLELKSINSELIYLSLTGYGQEGEMNKLAGHDLNYLAITGALFNDVSDIPQVPRIQLGDILGGSYPAVVAILAAIINRQTSGVGEYIDLAIQQSIHSVNLMDFVSIHKRESSLLDIDYLLGGDSPFYGLYETSDNKWLAAGMLEFKFWQKFCIQVERSEWLSLYLTDSSEQSVQLKKEMRQLFKGKTRDEWVSFFRGCDCCISPVLSRSEVHSFLSEKALSTEDFYEHPKEGKIPLNGLPFKSSAFEFTVRRPSPLPGEHSAEILTELGFNQEKIDSLKESGVIGG